MYVTQIFKLMYMKMQLFQDNLKVQTESMINLKHSIKQIVLNLRENGFLNL